MHYYAYFVNIKITKTAIQAVKLFLSLAGGLCPAIRKVSQGLFPTLCKCL